MIDPGFFKIKIMDFYPNPQPQQKSSSNLSIYIRECIKGILKTYTMLEIVRDTKIKKSHTVSS